MPFKETSIPGAWIYEPKVIGDSRGDFKEVFRVSEMELAIDFHFEPKQANLSRSHAGVLRGIHWATTPPGQAKHVSCLRGKIIDFVVDLRPDSPSFGSWDFAELTAENGNSLLISQGLGHGFLSLEDDSWVSYLCSEEFDPKNENSINPLGDGLGIDFSEFFAGPLLLSDRDLQAPSFNEWFLSS